MTVLLPLSYDPGADMSAQDILNSVQAIGSQGNYQMAPKLPKPVIPKFQPISVGAISPVPVGHKSNSSTGMSALDRLMAAIRSQESGGNYRATNPSGASGGYQMLKSNFVNPGGWDKEALGHDITYDQFMNSSSLQDAIARYKLGQYLAKYGLSGAAAAWYGGPGAVSHMYDKTPQAGGYPSLYAYIQSVLGKM
jgi:hypothetical protein